MSVKSDFCAEIYDVSQLNKVSGCFIKSGVTGIDDLKVIYRDGSAVVSKGKYILPDGSILTVDNEGHKLTVTNGYIYICEGEICCSDSPEPDSLLLARITDGECIDLRQRAYIYSGEGVN